MKRLVLLGAGGHARVVADTACALGRWREIVCLDDRFPELVSNLVWPVIGRCEDFEQLCDSKEDDLIVAIGHSRTRLNWTRRVLEKDFSSPDVVHPRSWVSSLATLEAGTVVFAGAVVNAGARLGLACVVNTGATIDHDCVLGDAVHVCPGAHIGGEVAVGDGSWIGIGSAVRHCIAIGRDVTIGAGAAVICDVPDGLTVVGVPGKPLKGQ